MSVSAAPDMCISTQPGLVGQRTGCSRGWTGQVPPWIGTSEGDRTLTKSSTRLMHHHHHCLLQRHTKYIKI